MKLLYLHQYFNSPDEPGATRSYEIARRLVARGHEVDLLTSNRSAGSASAWQTKDVDGIRVHSIAVPYENEMGFIDRMHAFSKFAVEARRYGSQLTFDLVYATSTPLTIAWPAVRLSKANHVPMVFEVRDLWPQVPIAIGAINHPLLQRAAYRLERYAYDNAAAIVSLSPGMTASIETRYPNSRVETIPNACDLELFGARAPVAGQSATQFRNTSEINTSEINTSEINTSEITASEITASEITSSENGPLIVYAGTFGTANGVEYAVRIASELSRIAPHIRMLLIGSGKCFEDVRRLALDLELLDKSVRIENPVSKADVAQVFQAADLALSLFIDLPILATNSANKFFDAIASGTPVAINYTGWQAELIRSADCGLVLPANDATKAAEQIAVFLSDRARATDAGARARRLAETTFDRNKLVDKLAVLLEEIQGESAVAEAD